MKKRQSLHRKYSMKLRRLWTEKDSGFMRGSHIESELGLKIFVLMTVEKCGE